MRRSEIIEKERKRSVKRERRREEWNIFGTLTVRRTCRFSCQRARLVAGWRTGLAIDSDAKRRCALSQRTCKRVSSV